MYNSRSGEPGNEATYTEHIFCSVVYTVKGGYKIVCTRVVGMFKVVKRRSAFAQCDSTYIQTL